jgi:hypothetical protein
MRGCIAEYVFERDRNEFNLGDTMDIKTGLILACLTFLAIQSGGLINGRLSLAETIAQMISIVALSLGGALSVLELWPRSYDREAVPDAYDKWLADMRQFYELNPADIDIATSVRSARVESAKERVRTNSHINEIKSRLMFYAFFCVVVAFAANIATLVMRLF